MLASARVHVVTGGNDHLPCPSRQPTPPSTLQTHGIRPSPSNNFLPTTSRRSGLKSQPRLPQYRQGDEVHAQSQAPLAPTALVANKLPSSPATATATAPTPTSPPPARAQLKVIGLGLRGISAVNRLIGSKTLPEAEFWALDSDKRVLSTADPSTRLLEVGPGDDASLGHAELTALSGGTSSPAAPEAPDGHAGAVFVLGSAFGSPGGAPMLLQLVRHLRRQGYFVAAALTRPFEFEGPRRLEAADTLISMMEEVAHLVVVIAQGVLTRASAELTMGQAEAIADNTLVYTVQSTLWALRAPEVLKVSHGAFLWHGRDLRNIRRPLFPPMMNLLSCPGHATLGRGQAALPLPLLQQAGLASALSTLAEDAVKAASESPFLDNKLESATGVLCVLRVPPSALGVTSGSSSRQGGSSVGNGGPLVPDNHKEYALRSAVQVAAMTVRELVGPHCHDIIVCPQLCHDLEAQRSPGTASQLEAEPARLDPGGGGAEQAAGAAAAATQEASRQIQEAVQEPYVRVEVSLLVLERIEEAAEPKAIAGQKSPSEAPASTAAAVAAASSYASPPPLTPTAATARDRMTSVMSPRQASVSPRRLPPPGAPTTAVSYFSGQLQQPTVPPAANTTSAAAAANSLGSQIPHPAWVGSADMTSQTTATVPGRVGGGPVLAPSPSSAGGVTAPAAPGGAGATSGGASTTAASASAGGAATAAESNLARKQARLAAMSAMSALAGGTAPGVGNGLHAGGAAGLYGQAPSTAAAAAGSARAGAAPMTGGLCGTGSSGGAWGGQLSARGYPQQQHLQHPQMGQQQQQAQPAQAPAAMDAESAGGMFGLHQIPRMAENLVTSLVAQSLDLPPQAARWRHQHRAPPKSTPPSPVFQLPKVDDEVDDSWLEGGGGGQGEGLGRGLQQLIMGMRIPGLAPDGVSAGAASAPLARNRVAGMLDQERKELWEAT